MNIRKINHSYINILLQESSDGMKENSDIQIKKLEKMGYEQGNEDSREKEIDAQESQVASVKTRMADTVDAKDLNINKNNKYATSKNSADVLNRAMDKLASKPYKFAPVATGKTVNEINRSMDKLSSESYEDRTIYPK